MRLLQWFLALALVSMLAVTADAADKAKKKKTDDTVPAGYTKVTFVDLDKNTFNQVVRGGALEERGMPNFKEFNDAKVENIRHYLRSRAAELRGEKAGAAPKPDSLQIR